MTIGDLCGEIQTIACQVEPDRYYSESDLKSQKFLLKVALGALQQWNELRTTTGFKTLYQRDPDGVIRQKIVPWSQGTECESNLLSVDDGGIDD